MKSILQRLARRLFLIFAVLLLWWTLRSVSAAEVWTLVRNLDPGTIALLITVNVLVLLTFSARWWLFLYAQGHRVPFLRLVGYRLTAFGISYLTPGPHFGGEPWQVYAVTRSHGVPYAHSIAAVTLDKLVEMLVNFAFLAAGVLFLLRNQVWRSDLGGPNTDYLPQLIVYVLLLLALPIGLLLAYRRGRHPVSKLLAAGQRLATGVTAKVRPGSLQASGATQPAWLQTVYQSESEVGRLCRDRFKILVAALAISTVSWFGVVWEFWIVTQLLRLELTFAQAILGLVAARVAILLPMPAALGVLEAGQALVMTSVGRGPAAGIGISLLIRARDILLALGGLWLGGFGVWQLLRGKREPVPTSPPFPERIT